MTPDLANYVINYLYAFWLGAFPLLLGLWIMKRWIYE